MRLRSLVSYPAIIFKDQANLNFFHLTVTTLSGHTEYNHVNTTMKNTQIVGERAGWWSRDAPTAKTGTKAEEVVVFPDIKTTRKDAEDVPAVWVFCSQL